eukprot:7093007-Ditylum_brightwellii.AAC.1
MGATIYVDHASDMLYVHLMQSLSGKEMLESKCAYEHFAVKHGITVKKYHSDNGQFEEKAFHNAYEMQGQQISFCGVRAHHQNDIEENCIKQLTL